MTVCHHTAAGLRLFIACDPDHAYLHILYNLIDVSLNLNVFRRVLRDCTPRYVGQLVGRLVGWSVGWSLFGQRPQRADVL